MTAHSTSSRRFSTTRSGSATLLVRLLLIWILTGSTATAQTLQGTQFSYQGQLKLDDQIAELKREKSEQDAELASLRADYEAQVAEMRNRMAQLERMVNVLASEEN